MNKPRKPTARGENSDGPVESARSVERLRDRLVKKFADRSHVRMDMLLILSACFGAGLIATKLLFWVGVTSMLWRYPLMILAAYGAFFLGIRIWLALAGYAVLSSSGQSSQGGSFSGGNSGSGGGGSWGGGSSGPSFEGGGGSFGGGGSSGSFDEPALGGSGSSAFVGGEAPVSGGSDSSFGSFSLGDSGSSGGGGGGGDGDGWLALVALAALVAVIFGSAVYVVYAAPTILADAVLAGALSGGLHRASRRIGAEDWAGSVWHDTRIPFALIFVLALVFAGVSQYYYPGAHTVFDLLRLANPFA
ncbi:MAG: hypothetical protein PHU46_05480 [Rhodocyclaceae bacterium]|nr:hypothetical protein [Rhodocyclaceae bacterium]